MSFDRLLSLDVSSSITGYAVLSRSGDLIQYGRIQPAGSWDAPRRIDAMADSVRELVGLYAPDRAVMEWSSGKTHRRVAKASGLSVLGAAQGAVREALRGAVGEIATVGEEWTRGRPKSARAVAIRLVYPRYAEWADRGEDPGLDTCDALGIAMYALGKLREAELMARVKAKGGGR